jgi:hypothetical protein
VVASTVALPSLVSDEVKAMIASTSPATQLEGDAMPACFSLLASLSYGDGQKLVKREDEHYPDYVNLVPVSGQKSRSQRKPHPSIKPIRLDSRAPAPAIDEHLLVEAEGDDVLEFRFKALFGAAIIAFA